MIKEYRVEGRVFTNPKWAEIFAQQLADKTLRPVSLVGDGWHTTYFAPGVVGPVSNPGVSSISAFGT